MVSCASATLQWTFILGIYVPVSVFLLLGDENMPIDLICLAFVPYDLTLPVGLATETADS